MAARENQGLQVAIIIFVLLTIMLSVSTFMLFRKYEEGQAQKNLADRDLSQAVARETALRAEVGALKQIIGAAPSDPLSSIQTQFRADTERFAAAFKNEPPKYHQLVGYLHAELAGSDARFVAAKEREAQLAAQVMADEQVKLGEIAKYALQLEATIADLTSERAGFNQARGDVELTKDDLAKQMIDHRKTFQQSVTKVEDENKKLVAALAKLKKLLDAFKEMIADRERFTEMPRGEITWVSQRGRLVTVNLGTADGLRRQTTFKVLSPDRPNLVDEPSKAKIEVVRVLDAHQAEARIVDDQIANPILPGDKIFSLAWAPNRAEHFALVGFMDFDGDRISDRARIKQLIAANGGVIDAEVGDDGKRSGELSINTRYVICGDRPSGQHASPEFMKAYSDLLGEAETLAVRRMSIEDFLNNVGYVPPPRLAALDGSGANEDFAAQAPEGFRRKANGVFAPRRPILTNSRLSAY